MTEETKDLIKTRPEDLRDARERTPLVEFKGKLDSWDTTQPDTYGRVFVELNFVEVEVIKSREPYHYPVAQIRIKYSDSKNSAWGMFLSSMGETEDHPVLAEDFLELPGRVLHMAKHIHDYGINPDTEEPMKGEVWELLGIEGEAPEKVDATERAIQLMEGKTEQEWSQAVFKDASVKADSALIQQIVSNTFLPALIEQGKVIVEDGILHVVKE